MASSTRKGLWPGGNFPAQRSAVSKQLTDVELEGLGLGVIEFRILGFVGGHLQRKPESWNMD